MKRPSRGKNDVEDGEIRFLLAVEEKERGGIEKGGEPEA